MPTTAEPTPTSRWLTGTLASGSAQIDVYPWEGGMVMTELSDSLRPFFKLTREVTWNSSLEWIDKYYESHRRGFRTIYVAWVPADVARAHLTAFLAAHGPKGMICIETDEPLDVDVEDLITNNGQILSVPATSTTYWPIGTIAVDWDNTDYATSIFGGVDQARDLYSCRATGVAAISVLAIPPPFQGRGYAKAMLDFSEQYAAGRLGAPSRPPAPYELGEDEDEMVPAHTLVRKLALHTSFRDKRNNRIYQRRGYTKTFVHDQGWGLAQFYVKDYVEEPLPAEVEAVLAHHSILRTVLVWHPWLCGQLQFMLVQHGLDLILHPKTPLRSVLSAVHLYEACRCYGRDYDVDIFCPDLEQFMDLYGKESLFFGRVPDSPEQVGKLLNIQRGFSIATMGSHAHPRYSEQMMASRGGERHLKARSYTAVLFRDRYFGQSRTTPSPGSSSRLVARIRQITEDLMTTGVVSP
ncbi:hypothetical protein GGF32_002251 [Allomyces javanicus]|nr:hypothetical protein GGF32_002251 [Allomyces javanicus]